MNKADAKKYACRLVCGFIEELYENSKDPLVYDEYFRDRSGKAKGKAVVEGRRLSKEDEERVMLAMEDLQVEISRKGWGDHDAYLEAAREKKLAWKWPKPAGKPGARWSKYPAWLKRQGRE